jgi:hypothetical protein
MTASIAHGEVSGQPGNAGVHGKGIACSRLAFSSCEGNDKMFPRKTKGIGTMYFGIVDIWVFIGYAFCLFSALLCVVYGLINWNKNGVDLTPEDVAWAEEEDAITKDL